MTMVVFISAWMRADYNRQQAGWEAADRLAAAGLDRRCIGPPRHWAEYHAFDDWIGAGHPGFAFSTPKPPAGAFPPPLHEPFYAWMNKRYWYATVRVALPWEPAVVPEWSVRNEAPYRDAYFGRQTVRTFMRRLDRPADAEPCVPPG